MLPIGFMLLFTQISLSLCQLVREYTEQNAQPNDAYHLAQVSPPGKYQIIIWANIIKGPPKQLDDCERGAIFYNNKNSNARNKHNDGTTMGEETWPLMRFRWLTLMWRNPTKLGQCFEHFHSVLTTDDGRFLLQKKGTIKNGHCIIGPTGGAFNVHIIPRERVQSSFADGTNTNNYTTEVIPEDDKISAVQKVYLVSKKFPVDKLLCRFDAQENANGGGWCTLNYFETFEESKSALVQILNQWFNSFDGHLHKKGTFFFIALLGDLIENVEKHCSANASVSRASWAEGRPCEAKTLNANYASLLDIFIKYFRHESEKETSPLFDCAKLRLNDARVSSLIGKFCRVNQQTWFTPQPLDHQFKSHDFEPYFCEKWILVYEKMVHVPAYALNYFRQWLQPKADDKRSTNDELSNVDEKMSDELRQIIKFWMTTLSTKITQNCSSWSTNEMLMMRNLGEMLGEITMSSGIFAMKTFDKRMKEVQCESEFGQICSHFFNFWKSCGKNADVEVMLLAWKSVVQHVHRNQTAASQLLTTDSLDKKFEELLNAAPDIPTSSNNNNNPSQKRNGENSLAKKAAPTKHNRHQQQRSKCDWCQKEQAEIIAVDCRLNHQLCAECLEGSKKCPKCLEKKGNRRLRFFSSQKCFQK